MQYLYIEKCKNKIWGLCERSTKIKLQEMPLSERPYEKLELYGESFLSNSELLAIIIGSGTKDETSITLAQKVLNLNGQVGNNLRLLQDITITELMKIKGIGKVKAIRLKALGEITKRMEKPIKNEVYIKSSKDVASLLMPEMRFEKKEIVKLIILNVKNKVLKIINISLGSTNYAIIEPKDILTEPIKMEAPKIILVHNHPSGNPKPSLEDVNITNRLYRCSKLLGIELLDHIVIGDGIYESIKFQKF